MRALFLAWLVLLTLYTSAQFTDHFSDGDFTDNPVWSGMNDHFRVDAAYRLQLRAPAQNGKSYLCTPSAVKADACWEFSVFLDFNPSSSNQVKVYVCSDKMDLTDSLNGYFILIGGSADEVALYRQKKKGTTKLIDGRDKMLDREVNALRIKVSLVAKELWQLDVDYGNGDFYREGEKTDRLTGDCSWTGVLCEYTSTRSDKFRFDDFVVRGSTAPDNDFPGKSPVPGDLVFSEIMADPSPSKGLPEVEYIELVNRSDRELDLYGCRLNNIGFAAHFTVRPGQYFLVTDSAAVTRFGDSIAICPLKLGASFLTNTGKLLTLVNEDGVTICSLDYRAAWYGPKIPDGGISLELCNVALRCPESAMFWKGSVHQHGGTPGAPAAGKPCELSVPLFPAAMYWKDSVLTQHVNQPLLAAGKWSIDPPLPEFRLLSAGQQLIRFYLPVSEGTVYTIKADSLTACLDTIPGSFSVRVSMPVAPDSLKLSELLYDPVGKESDFLEVYNPTAAFVSLRNVSVTAKEGLPGKIVDSLGLILPPFSYLAISEDTLSIIRQFPQTARGRLLQTPLPAFVNRSGYVGLLDATDALIDEMHYSDELHHPQLGITEGVSLERVSFDIPGTTGSNWTSGSAYTGHATPGYRNAGTPPATGSGLFDLSSKLITPNGDDHNDKLIIRVSLPEPLPVSISVFNASGHLVSSVAKEEPVTGTRSFDWPAEHEMQHPAGPYIVLLEVFGNSGRKELRKEAVVISR
ncbi:MAG: lamin tail domain-containing protein [Bacteroidota bacterium]